MNKILEIVLVPILGFAINQIITNKRSSKITCCIRACREEILSKVNRKIDGLVTSFSQQAINMLFYQDKENVSIEDIDRRNEKLNSNLSKECINSLTNTFEDIFLLKAYLRKEKNFRIAFFVIICIAAVLLISHLLNPINIPDLYVNYFFFVSVCISIYWIFFQLTLSNIFDEIEKRYEI